MSGSVSVCTPSASLASPEIVYMTVNERDPVKPFASDSTSTGQSPSVCFCAS